jgi:hypothetical protein
MVYTKHAVDPQMQPFSAIFWQIGVIETLMKRYLKRLSNAPFAIL